jgi:hypothetical protein
LQSGSFVNCSKNQFFAGVEKIPREEVNLGLSPVVGSALSVSSVFYPPGQIPEITERKRKRKVTTLQDKVSARDIRILETVMSLSVRQAPILPLAARRQSPKLPQYHAGIISAPLSETVPGI